MGSQFVRAETKYPLGMLVSDICPSNYPLSSYASWPMLWRVITYLVTQDVGLSQTITPRDCQSAQKSLPARNPGIFTELYFLDWTLSSTPSEYIKVLGYAFTTVLDLDGHDALLHGLQPRLRMSQPIVYLSFLASTPETRFGRQDSAWWIPPHSSNPAVLQSQYQSNILARRTEASRPYSRSRRGRDSPPHPEGPLTGCHVILDTFKNAQKASIDRGPPPENYSFTQGSAQASASSSSSSSSTSSSTAPDYSSQHPAHFVRRQPRIQVSSLLASDPTARSYQLEVIQHPEKTAEFRNAHLSRLPLNPPLIVRLIVRDTSGNLVMPEVEIPFLLAHLSLYSEDGQTRLDDPGQWGEDGPPLLYGNLVASLDILEDAPGRQGLFFVFPDVSVRWEGRYQLQLTLMRISSPSSMDAQGRFTLGESGDILAEQRTAVFEVLPLAEYVAMPHTALTQSFIRQGARIFSSLPSQPPPAPS